MIKLQNVLVATDFSKPSETALTYGRDLARAFGATLHVLHVVEDIAARAIGVEGSLPDLSGAQRVAEEAARRELDAVVREDDRRELGARAVLRTANTPALAIVACAQEIGADLIVLGTHGRGGMARVFAGSVAERVVRSAPCPVLTVRHPEHEFVLPDALQGTTQA